MIEKLQFSLLLMFEEKAKGVERYVDIEKELFETLENTFFINYESIYYEVIVDLNDDYIWFSIDYGNPLPKDENLTNIETGEKHENNRADDEVELTSQLFALYDFKTRVFYISNLLKQKFFEEILYAKLKRTICLKKLLKDRKDFIDIFKEIKEIKFTDVNNLFNNNEQRQALVDLTGIDAPNTFTITAEYKNNQNVKDFINKLFNSENYQPSSLVIKGIDENDFDFIYNKENFVKKIAVNSMRNKYGKFDGENIKNELNKIIRNEG